MSPKVQLIVVHGGCWGADSRNVAWELAGQVAAERGPGVKVRWRSVEGIVWMRIVVGIERHIRGEVARPKVVLVTVVLMDHRC